MQHKRGAASPGMAGAQNTQQLIHIKAREKTSPRRRLQKEDRGREDKKKGRNGDIFVKKSFTFHQKTEGDKWEQSKQQKRK